MRLACLSGRAARRRAWTLTRRVLPLRLVSLSCLSARTCAMLPRQQHAGTRSLRACSLPTFRHASGFLPSIACGADHGPHGDPQGGAEWRRGAGGGKGRGRQPAAGAQCVLGRSSGSRPWHDQPSRIATLRLNLVPQAISRVNPLAALEEQQELIMSGTAHRHSSPPLPLLPHHQLAQAIERVNDLDPEILEEQQELFFHLQQQRLIELIRGGQLAEALEFAQVGRCGGVCSYIGARGHAAMRPSVPRLGLVGACWVPAGGGS